MRSERGGLGRIIIIRLNFTRQECLDALAEFYTKNKRKYPHLQLISLFNTLNYKRQVVNDEIL